MGTVARGLIVTVVWLALGFTEVLSETLHHGHVVDVPTDPEVVARW
jgi:hypothetical protein